MTVQGHENVSSLSDTVTVRDWHDSLATHIVFVPNVAIPSPTLRSTPSQATTSSMLTAFSLSLNDSETLLGAGAEAEKRETFSHQTLILTVLAAINNPNHHPTFKATEVNNERIQYMKDKTNHIPVIDAATTILVTHTEILATMTRGVNTHGLVAIKEIVNQEPENDSLLPLLSKLSHSVRCPREIDEVLPDSESGDPDRMIRMKKMFLFRSLTPTQQFPYVPMSPTIRKDHPSEPIHHPTVTSANQSSWIRVFGPTS
jgi:hypothetical protein